MGKKENICATREEDLGTYSLSRETPMQKNRNQEAGGRNLRKSMAWNQAFFTEEGVLNPLELSILSGSLTKSNGSVLSAANGEMSPLTVYSECSVRAPLHDLEVNLYSKLHANSQTKDKKAKRLFSKPESSNNEEPEAHVASGKLPPAKNLIKSVPRSPASYSQKRASYVNASNPTSKIPKFMPTKFHASSFPTASRNVMLTGKISKYDQTVAKDKVGQTVGLKGSPVNKKRDSSFSYSSAKLSADNHGKNMSFETHSSPDSWAPQFKRGTGCLKVIPEPSSSTIACSGQLASSMKRSIRPVCGGLPAPVHAKPSALRMPSPSLGFFCQEKASPSNNNQCQRNTQPSGSKIPSLRKRTDLQGAGELGPLTSTGRQPTNGTSATKSSASGSSQSCLAANPLNLSPTPNPCLRLKAKEMKQLDLMERSDSISSRSNPSQRILQEQLNNDCFLAGHNIDKQSQELSLNDPDKAKVSYIDDTISQVSSNSLVEGSEVTPEYLETNVPDSICDSGQTTRDSKGNEVLCLNSSSKTCFPGTAHQNISKELQVGDRGTDIVAKQSIVGDTGDETYALTSENKQSAQNTEIMSDIRSGLAVRNLNCAASAEAETSSGKSKEQVACADADSSLVLDKSLTQNSGISIQTANQGSAYVTNGPGSTLLEEFQHTLHENSELQGCRLQCDLKCEVCSANEDVLVPDKEVFTHKLNKERDLLKQPLNAAPFSDEWLAALDTFGEDILKLKTGPVQNSPTDKALSEPNPWSPVKRKAQDIGPFDCTKYAKNLSTPNTQ